MLDKQKQNQHSKFKDNIFSFNPSNTVQPSVSDSLQDLDPNNILDRAILFIHRIKDHHHNKIKAKQINKFECLYYKIHGYHHNLTWHNNSFDNIDHNNSSLGGQPNVPSSIPPRTSTPSTTSNIPATPGPPTPSTTTTSNPTTQANSNSSNTSNQHTCRAPLDKWVVNLSSTPYPANNYPYYKKDLTMPLSPNTPQ